MPSEESHLLLAQHNQDLIDHLLPDIGRFSDWITTIAFYKAVHIVEAVFAKDPNVRHGRSHEYREQRLKSDRRYSQIYKFYRPLWAASTVAHYLEDRVTKSEKRSFSEYLSPEQVKAKILDHYLHQIEQSASKFVPALSPSKTAGPKPPAK